MMNDLSRWSTDMEQTSSSIGHSQVDQHCHFYLKKTENTLI